MVYYGAASKGCERCRKRKVKCDEQRPQCLKCIKLGILCPGYRDLNDVVFRDESQRIIKNAHRFDSSQPADLECGLQQVKIRSPRESSQSSPSDLHQAPKLLLLMPQQPVEEVGAGFFFTKYGFDLPPFYKGYDTWLSQTYFGGNSMLRPVIESIGMAGLANMTNTPDMMSRAHRRYQEGIARVNEALNDPVEGLTDEAFMSVILLAFFETVSFQDWDRYRHWLDHIKAATALLELRGQAQFLRQRGAQLFIQIRSQILLACVQQRLTVPPAVVQATYCFETGSLRAKLKSKYVASPGSISEISLRVVNLRAAAKNKSKSREEYREAAYAIEADLIMWADVAPKQWNYTEVEGPEGEGHYRGKRHVYQLPWSVEMWNNWRVLRIAVSQIMVQDVTASSLEVQADKEALKLIREMSEDICISVSAFSHYPRTLSLIRPLYIVATEPRNEDEARRFAIKHLRRLGIEMGVRQPVLLADRIQQYMAEEAGIGGMSAMECDTFMLSGPY